MLVCGLGLSPETAFSRTSHEVLLFFSASVKNPKGTDSVWEEGKITIQTGVYRYCICFIVNFNIYCSFLYFR